MIYIFCEVNDDLNYQSKVSEENKYDHNLE